jgi:hypothetical protein
VESVLRGSFGIGSIRALSGLSPHCATHGSRCENLVIKAKPIGSPLTHGRGAHRKKARSNAVSKLLRQAVPPARSTIRVLDILYCEPHCRVCLLCLGQPRIGQRKCLRRTAGTNPAEKQHTPVIQDAQVHHDYIKGSRRRERLKWLPEEVELRKESAAGDNRQDGVEFDAKKIESSIRRTIGGIESSFGAFLYFRAKSLKHL